MKRDNSGVLDIELINRIKSGDTEALEKLVTLYNDWIYNIVFRMLGNTQDAEDLTQEILLKVVSNLASFKGKSKLSTWIYRIAVNSALDFKKSASEKEFISLSAYADSIHNTPDMDLPDNRYSQFEETLLIEETRLSCIMGMLLCLDRKQRIAFILGEMFNFTDSFASEILNISKAAFRKRLQRARNDLYRFMNNECGLIDPRNKCICKKKTKALIDSGYVDPLNLTFSDDKVKTIKEQLQQRYADISQDLSDIRKEMMQNQPFYKKDEIITHFKEMLVSNSFNHLYSSEIEH